MSTTDKPVPQQALARPDAAFYPAYPDDEISLVDLAKILINAAGGFLV